MPPMGIEQQLVVLSNKHGAHVRGLLRTGDVAGARAALERFAVFVADELRGAPQERTGRRLDTEPPPASATVAPDDDEPAVGDDVAPRSYNV